MDVIAMVIHARTEYVFNKTDFIRSNYERKIQIMDHAGTGS